MLAFSIRGAILGEGGYQEFPLTPETSWGPVIVALLVGAVVGGTVVALYIGHRRRTPPSPPVAPPPSE